jgi:hypothetical protein
MNAITHRIIGALIPLCMVTGGVACAPDESSDAIPDEAATGASEEAFTVALESQGLLRGHEDITRIAIDQANAILGYAYYPTATPDDETPHWTSAVIRGNWETDVPSQRMRNFYPEVGSDWHGDPVSQNIHSLRNYPGAKVESARNACLGARKLIDRAATEGLKQFKASRPWYGFYYTGHGSHVLQDSFSAAHTARSGAGLRTLDDVCTYGKSFPGVCLHHTLDTRDKIWRLGGGCTINTNLRGMDCMKPEAQAAVTATRDYLVAMAKVVGGKDDLAPALRVIYDKYLNCDTLPR